MNHLTAYRTFGKPSYCPVKSTRIQSNKWYLVEMQDVETDPRCDYVGLKDTSTIYLYNGIKTRQERDSRLNHCNRIIEYTGPVFELKSDKQRIIEYYPSIDTANQSKLKHDEYITKSLSEALASIAKQQAMTDSEILKIYGNCHNWPGNETMQIAKFRQDLVNCKQRNIAYWHSDITITQIR